MFAYTVPSPWKYARVCSSRVTFELFGTLENPFRRCRLAGTSGNGQVAGVEPQALLLVEKTYRIWSVVLLSLMSER